MFTHRLKIKGWVTVGDHGGNAAHLGGKGPDSVSAADGGGTHLFMIHDQQAGLIGQGADNGIGTVNDQPAAGIT